MGTIHVTTVIGAEPAAVWQAIEPVERHVEWMADAVAIRFEGEQTRGVGTRFVCVTKVGPITLHDHLEIDEWEPARAMGVRHVGVVTGRGRFTLEPAGDGHTRFAWQEGLRFPWYLGGRVTEAFGGRAVLRRIWQGNLRRLKAQVESGSPAAP